MILLFCYYSALFFRSFLIVKIGKIAGGTLGIDRSVEKCIHSGVKVIVQGQDHRLTLSKKVMLGTTTK